MSRKKTKNDPVLSGLDHFGVESRYDEISTPLLQLRRCFSYAVASATPLLQLRRCFSYAVAFALFSALTKRDFRRAALLG